MNIPFEARREAGERVIAFLGSKASQAVADVRRVQFPRDGFPSRVEELPTNAHWKWLHVIDRVIFRATVDFFHNIGADWCNLPVTTRMISSPGEVYAGRTLDYTTDTLPVSLSWFDVSRPIYLSESSQFYLELRLLVPGVNKVFSVYNSFRKERADFCRLAEFQLIEYEAVGDGRENEETVRGLLRAITGAVVNECPEALAHYLGEGEIATLSGAFDEMQFQDMTLEEALEALRRDTGDDRYAELSLKHFGAWEEIRMTQIVGKHVILREFPCMEVPFYHACQDGAGAECSLARNADFILAGYREVVGSGVRISDSAALLKKARIFNLPEQDYKPYISTRGVATYRQTAGFGLGWQRYVQWLLKLPCIWMACHAPRGDGEPTP